MSASRQATMKDLAEEAKKRIVYLAICTVGLSYLMSLTSSSVWVNLPAAATLIIALRYFALDLEMRRKAAVYNSKKPAVTTASKKKPIQGPRVVERTNWRRKVDSPIVEVAMDRFTRHLVSEWVTDLWYSRLTPDREGPEELVHIINDVLAEFSDRVRNINLIDLLTRDIVCLICTHLEIFRMSQAKIYKQRSEQLTSQQLDSELRRILALENKLHPALFSTDAEHKVLQHVMDGLISFAFKPEDLQCSFFRYIVRELLACAVMRPVLNLANPRFINERIEAFVISKTTANKGAVAAQEASPSKNGTTRVSSDHFSKFLDPTATGVELVQLKTNLSKTTSDARTAGDTNGKYLSKDPLLSMDARSTRSWNSFPADSQNGVHTENLRHRSGGEWGEMLDVISRRKAQALAPEHFENMWTKGRNYRKKEGENRLIEQVPQRTPASKAVTADHCNTVPKSKGKNEIINNNNPGGSTSLVRNSCIQPKQTFLGHSLTSVAEEDDEHGPMRLEETDFGSSSDTCEDEESGTVTGLDSPGTKVWDGKSKRNLAVAPIHHPLESFEGTSVRKNSKGHSRYQRIHCAPSGRKRSRLSNTKVHVWQEVERTSFLSGDGQDILSTPKGYGDDEDSSGGDSDNEVLGRANSWEGASSSAPSMSLPENRGSSINKVQNSLRVDSFLKLRCEVLGANIVKSGSKTFAVYSISVTDVNNNSWSIKRRFRHFEELHRRLKEFPEYNLHLPPKHFLSTGLDISVIQERCKLLDRYLKNLMQLPTVSGSIEVWDFLSVDSQTYYFLNSFSIVETLSVDLEDKPAQKSKKVLTFSEPTGSPSSSRKEKTVWDNKETALQMKHDPPVDYSRLHAQEQSVNSRENDTTEQTSDALLDATTDPTLPSEWVPPNLSMPLLDLVDVIFQLQDGGWIRRKVFWVAKQILQLGMGDAFDDWLIEKIQLLRKGSVIASGINRLEQILWPDGIFITKHPKRRRAPPPSNISQSSPRSPQPSEISPPRQLDEQQQLEAEQRAKFVYEIMIDRAPAAIVGIVGRKEYEQCAKDLYFFLQSAVCLKLLAFDLLELLLLSAFPELDFVFKQLYEEKHKFGEYRES